MIAWYKRLFQSQHEDDLIKPQNQQEREGAIDLSTYEKEPENIIIDSSSDVGGIVGHGITFGDNFSNVSELVRKYREMVIYSHVDDAVNEVVNEAIVKTDETIVDVTLEDTELPESIKETIYKEFHELLYVLDWRDSCSEIFRQWYIDGRLYSQNIYNPDSLADGIVGINILSPFNLTRMRNKEGKQYYVYKIDENNKDYSVLNRRYEYMNQYKGFVIPDEHINYTHSGMTDPTNSYYISHLHKAIKPFNQLKMLEDSSVIYAFTRAPERRAFYISVGKMAKAKADEYVKNLMNRFKNRIIYDSSSGSVLQQKNTMIMNEDFYLPTSEDGRGTKIENIAGGTQLPDLINNMEYFKKNLLKSLKVPYGRFDVAAPGMFSFDNNSKEIARDEMRFSKYINDLREVFARGFLLEILKKSIIAKNIIDLDEWEEIKNDIRFVWAKDQYYEDMAKIERMKSRIEMVGTISGYIGKKGYFSKGYIYREILNMTEEEIKKMRKEIAFEEKIGEVSIENEQTGGFESFDGGSVEPPTDAGDVMAPGTLSTTGEAPPEGEEVSAGEEAAPEAPAAKEKPQPKNPI